MTALLEALCSALDAEVERQENILAACRAQAEAARAQDLPRMEAGTAALLGLVRESADAAKARARIVEQIAAQARVPRQNLSLPTIIDLASDPYAGRLSHYRTRLKDVLGQVRAVVRANAGSFRVALGVLGRTLESLDLCAAWSLPGYNACGGAATPYQQAGLLDQRG